MSQTKKQQAMTQQNWYTITSASGQETTIRIIASNMKEAMKIAKEKYRTQIYFGKLKRVYDGGVRG